MHICVRTLLMIVEENNRDIHEKYIHETFQHLTNSNKFLMYSQLFRFVSSKIPDERYLNTCLDYYQVSLAISPKKTREDNELTKLIENHLQKYSQFEQVMTSILPIEYPYPAQQPTITKQLLHLLRFKKLKDETEIVELHPEETLLLERLKNLSKENVKDIVISVVRLYQNHTSLRAFILIEVLECAVAKRINLDPRIILTVDLHILRAMNEMLESNNVTAHYLDFDNILESNENVFDILNYTNVVYDVLEFIETRQHILCACIAKPIIHKILKVENLIPNVEKSRYYALLSHLSCFSGDFNKKKEYHEIGVKFHAEYEDEFFMCIR